MSLLRDLFSPNFILSPAQRQTLRASIKKWGVTIGLLVVVVLVFLGLQNPSPESGRAFDVATKAAFGLMRAVLAVVGLFLGGFLGYVLFQILESTRAGNHVSRIDGKQESAHVMAAKILARATMLVVLVAVGALTMALALAGAGGF